MKIRVLLKLAFSFMLTCRRLLVGCRVCLSNSNLSL